MIRRKGLDNDVEYVKSNFVFSTLTRKQVLDGRRTGTRNVTRDPYWFLIIKK